MHVILDVSRLLLSVRCPAPSGIDRVEMAYLRHFLGRTAAEASFVAQSPWGWYGLLPRERVGAFAEALAACWQQGRFAAAAAHARAWRLTGRIQFDLAAGAGRAGLRALLQRQPRCAFLLVSHRSLDRDGPIQRLRDAGAAFVPLLHDIIPLSHAEYARPAQVGRHARRVGTVSALADGLLVNSAATAAELAACLPETARPPVAIAPLGVAAAPTAPMPPPQPQPGSPYFLCLGTIEPRKNHLLLLHLWRALANAGGAVPRLVIVGRRGWENENVLDLLDRCAALRGLVEEHGALPDHAVGGLLAGARALLFPSFAEGYGLPVAEAMAAGVPVICSDLPALREIAGTVPEMLDPLDGRAWRDMILDYAAPDSPRRTAQLARLADWRPPSWDAHFAVVDSLLERAVARRAARRGRAPGRVPVPVPAAARRAPRPADATLAAAAGPASA